MKPEMSVEQIVWSLQAGELSGLKAIRLINEHVAAAAPGLRDEFAKAALTGMFSTPGSHLAFKNAAAEAYLYADAMLEARKPKGAKNESA